MKSRHQVELLLISRSQRALLKHCESRVMSWHQHKTILIVARMSVALDAISADVGVSRWSSGRVHHVVAARQYDPESFQLPVSVQDYLKEGRSELEVQVSKIPSITIVPICEPRKTQMPVCLHGPSELQEVARLEYGSVKA